MSIGIFVPNWIGDAVMATPALRALRKRFPRERIVGIMKPGVAPVFAGYDWFDETWLYNDPSSEAHTRTELIGKMRRVRFDTCLLFTNSLGTALLSWLGGARKRVGYARDGRSFLLTAALQPPRSNRKLVPYPALDYYLALAYELGCATEPAVLDLRTETSDELMADRVWHEAGIRPGAAVVTCNSSGAFGAAKLWPDEYFRVLAIRVANDLGAHVVFLCGPDERKRIGNLVRSAAHPRITGLAPYDPSIGLSKACVRRSNLLISTDSGPRHFGAAFNIPVIALFGPTDMRWSDTHYGGEVRLQQELECCPCQQRICPLKHHRCMTDLTVDTVFEEVLKILESTKLSGWNH